MFPYWEEGNHDGHRKGRTVVHLGDRSFQDVRLYVLFLGHQMPSLECPGAVFSPLTLHQSGIVRHTKGKTWHHKDKKSQSRQCNKAKANVRPFMS